MRALMLAAGMGKRLFGEGANKPPKSLLSFNGKSLLARHIETLKSLGFSQMMLVVGYRSEDILAEIQRLGAQDFVTTRHNPDFHLGTVLSMWTGREALTDPEGVIYMDADVLYHPSLMQRLLTTPHPNCLLLDRDFEDGDDPVKLCIKGANPVEFRKKPDPAISYDFAGEWPGFMRISPQLGAQITQIIQTQYFPNRLDQPMEEPIRDLIISSPPQTFGYEDITNTPWIEIDFPQDIQRAQNEILPHI